MNRRLRRAPDPEWVLMYRRGLSRGRITDLVRAPARTVAYHLAIARAQDPDLEVEHTSAAEAGSSPRVMPRGLQRMDQLIAMVQSEGRYPSSKATDLAERGLAVWLQRRRRDSAEGNLAPAFQVGLESLPGWQKLGKTTADQARWQRRLAQLARYRATGNDWPRHKGTDTELEHTLGVWLHTQRYKQRRGELAPAKVQALDTELPGWRNGRARGRKPRT